VFEIPLAIEHEITITLHLASAFGGITGMIARSLFRQPDAVDDPLSEVARQGARRMLAQVLIAEADAFVAQWKDLKLPETASCVTVMTATRNPDGHRACRGPARQGARPRRR
jgi:hypothetical protein